MSVHSSVWANLNGPSKDEINLSPRVTLLDEKFTRFASDHGRHLGELFRHNPFSLHKGLSRERFHQCLSSKAGC